MSPCFTPGYFFKNCTIETLVVTAAYLDAVYMHDDITWKIVKIYTTLMKITSLVLAFLLGCLNLNHSFRFG